MPCNQKREMRILEPSLPQIQTAEARQPTAPAPHKNRFSTSRMAGSQPVWQPKGLHSASFAPQNTPEAAFSGVPAEQRLGFADFLDVINPLQHIPVVATLYRKATGDQISAPAQFMGGVLFGGPLGAASAMADVAMRERTGKGFGENVAALAFDRDRAFKSKDLDMQLATAPHDIEPTSGRKYAFGALPRTAGLMPVADETRFAALMSALQTT